MPNKTYELSVANTKDHRNPQSLQQHRRSADLSNHFYDTKTLGGTVNQNISENDDNNQIHCVIVRDNPGLVLSNVGDRDDGRAY